MSRSDIMDIAKEIQTEWIAIDNEWIDHKPKSVRNSDRPWIHTLVKGGHWKKEIPDEFKRKISSFIGILVEDFAPVDSLATDELRMMLKRGGMKSVDWKKCDDQTFPLFVLRNLTLNYDVPIASRDELIAESWNKFSETFGDLISDASRTPQESAEYHKGIANLAEWRAGGCCW